MKRREEQGGDGEAAVAGELHQVLAGVAVGSGVGDVDPAVDRLAVGIMEAGQHRVTRWMGLEVGDDSGGDLEGPGPADPDDRQR